MDKSANSTALIIPIKSTEFLTEAGTNEQINHTRNSDILKKYTRNSERKEFLFRGSEGISPATERRGILKNILVQEFRNCDSKKGLGASLAHWINRQQWPACHVPN